MKKIKVFSYDESEASAQRENATNYFRLVQLTMIEGTNIVRKNILNRLQQRKTLHTILEERKDEFLQRGSGFNRQQLDVLYPTSGYADLAKIDMTLWFALARRLRVLPKTYLDDLLTERNGNSNDKTPLLAPQILWHQDLATIHAVRNNLFHLMKPEMETEIFRDQWSRLTKALFRLDPDLDPGVVERYRTSELNPKAAHKLREMVREQCADEVRKKNRVIKRILFVVVLVILIVFAAVLLFVLLVKLPRNCEKDLEYRHFGNQRGFDFMPRRGWGAVPPSPPPSPLIPPVPYVLYTHTPEISQCSVTQECCHQVKNIQYLQMQMRAGQFLDIGYHYMIDDKGIVFEGRNISTRSALVLGWNNDIISVAFIGNFMYQTPTTEALTAFDLLIAYLRLKDYIVKNYTIYAMCELENTESPARILYEAIDDSKLKHLLGHVRHRYDNYCSTKNAMTGDSVQSKIQGTQLTPTIIERQVENVTTATYVDRDVQPT